MRRFLSAAALALTAIFAVSCVIDDSTECHRTESNIRSLSKQMLDETATQLVSHFNSLKQESGDILDNPTVRFELDCGAMIIAEQNSADNWDVRGQSEVVNFTTHLTRKDDVNADMCKWILSELKVTYEEDNGYSSKLETSGDIEYAWEMSYWHNSMSMSWYVGVNGTTITNTYKDGKLLDTIRLVYSKGEVVNSIFNK